MKLICKILIGLGLLFIPLSAVALTTVPWQRNSGTGESPIYASDSIQIGTTTPTTATLELQGSGSKNALEITSSTGSSLLTVLANGNVGIGTTTPNQLLTVYGNLSVATSSTPALFVNTATTQVGIGTSTPAANLAVQGVSGSTLPEFIVATSTNAPNLIVTSAGNVGINSTSPNSLLTLKGSGTGTANDFMFTDSNNVPLVVMEGNGRVGIGTTTPSTTVHVVATAQGGGIRLDPDNSTDYSALGFGGMSSTAAANALIYSNQKFIDINSQAGSALYLNFDNTNTGSTIDMFNGKVVVQEGGNVGIGTAVPGSKLTIGDGTTNPLMTINGITGYAGIVIQNNGTEKIYFGNDGTDSTNDFILRQGGTTNVIRSFISGAVANTLVLNAGNVGIGTASPQAKLDVSGTASSTAVQTNHIIGNSTAPTIATSTGVGTGAGTTVSLTGTDLAGFVNFTTTNAPAANATINTITFNAAYASAPFCQITSATTTPTFIDSVWATTTTSTLLLKSSTTALAATSTYAFYYHCNQ